MAFGFLKQLFKRKKSEKKSAKKATKAKTKKKPSKTHKSLKDWEQLYHELQTHPLTQSKIINEQLLETTNDSLKKVNFRLDNMDDRISKLERKSKRKKSTEKAKPKILTVKELLSDPRLSDHERRILQFIKKQSATDAKSVSKKFNISRSNASLKLNKLFSWGILHKDLSDKTVFYKLKI